MEKKTSMSKIRMWVIRECIVNSEDMKGMMKLIRDAVTATVITKNAHITRNNLLLLNSKYVTVLMTERKDPRETLTTCIEK